jgi:hypothetical protein
MRHDFPLHPDETKVLDMSTQKYMHDMYGLKVLSPTNDYEYATLRGYILLSENHYVTYVLKSDSKDLLEGDWLYCNDDTVYAGVDEGLILAGFAYYAIYQKTVEAEYHRVLHNARMKVIQKKEDIVCFRNMFLLLHPDADETELHAAVWNKFFSSDMHQHLLWPTGEPDSIGKIYVSWLLQTTSMQRVVPYDVLRVKAIQEAKREIYEALGRMLWCLATCDPIAILTAENSITSVVRGHMEQLMESALFKGNAWQLQDHQCQQWGKEFMERECVIVGGYIGDCIGANVLQMTNTNNLCQWCQITFQDDRKTCGICSWMTDCINADQNWLLEEQSNEQPQCKDHKAKKQNKTKKKGKKGKKGKTK